MQLLVFLTFWLVAARALPMRQAVLAGSGRLGGSPESPEAPRTIPEETVALPPVAFSGSDVVWRAIFTSLNHVKDLDVWRVKPRDGGVFEVDFRAPHAEESSDATLSVEPPTKLIPSVKKLLTPESEATAPAALSAESSALLARFLDSEDAFYGPLAESFIHKTYHPYADFGAILLSFASHFPEYASVTSLGKSVERREIWAVRLRSPHSTAGPRKRAVVVAGQHPREWIGPATALYLIHALLLSTKDATHSPLDDLDVTFVPLSNPDGYAYSWETDRLWRKSRQPIAGSVGIDLASDWGRFESVELRAIKDFLEEQWGDAADSADSNAGDSNSIDNSSVDNSAPANSGANAPDSNTSPLPATRHDEINSSTDESLPLLSQLGGSRMQRWLRSSMNSLGHVRRQPGQPERSEGSPLLVTPPGLSSVNSYPNPPALDPASLRLAGSARWALFLDLHSYAQQILYPYASTCGVSPPNAENLLEAGLGAARAIRRVHHAVFQTGAMCALGAPTEGNSIDYAYANLRAKYAYAFELRDFGTYGFLLPSNQILPSGEEIYAGLASLVDFVVTH